MSTSGSTRSTPGRLAIVATVVFQSFLGWYALDPSVGFDDANITQAYARNIASGHGFVYNIGGERVEGSTSFLWTLLNVVGFWIGPAILFLTVLSFAITIATLECARVIAANLAGDPAAGVVTILLFNFFPAYFAWSLWSLMDTGLFVLAIAALTASMFVTSGARQVGLLMLWSALLPLVRPEGIAVAGAAALFLLVAQKDRKEFNGLWWRCALAALVSFASLTLFRLWYFGYPAPNTFYAKTSSDFAGQLVQGADYLSGWLSQPQNFLLALSTGLACAILARDEGRARMYAYYVIYMFAGGVVIYTLLGGDHFGGGRFFQFVIPLALPAIAFATAHVIDRMKQDTLPLSIGGASILAGVCFVAAKFILTNDGLAREIRYAEGGREIGHQLNESIGRGRSVAVIAAGGVRMGYDGVIYDALGLNWVRMAHSAGAVETDRPKNHGGFVDSVFLEARPDIAFPHRIGCDRIGESLLSDFESEVLGGFDDDPRFRANYRPLCNDTLSFFVREDLVPEINELGFRAVLTLQERAGS